MRNDEIWIGLESIQSCMGSIRGLEVRHVGNKVY